MGFACPRGLCCSWRVSGLICMRLLLQLLQDAVTPLVVFPRLLSFLGTFLHLQLSVGRTASGFPGGAIIIILGNFSAGTRCWEGLPHRGLQSGAPCTLWSVAVPAAAGLGSEAHSCMMLLQALRYQKRLCPCT